MNAPPAPSSARATLIGMSAILMWSALAILSVWAGGIPPFLLAALAFGFAFAFAAMKWVHEGGSLIARLRWPGQAWALGVGGLFGYHFLYFMALRQAPPAEASLIAYLWPLLIVLFSAALPGERLRWWHVGGALMGLAGTAALVTGAGSGTVGFKAEYLPGYLLAGACAAVWAVYSVLSRRLAHVPTEAVGAFLGASAALAFVAHLIFETPAWPKGLAWFAVAALGMGPVGLAFFAWDIGMKKGDIRVLGAAAYAAPLLSTLLLIAFGKAQATASLGIGCALIVGGAVLAARDMFRRR